MQGETVGATIINFMLSRLTSANDRITTIFHVSDIHIRLNSRKEEYELVFDRLYKMLKSHDKITSSVIVITGDLLHNKSDLTPECILLSYSFLHHLGAIAPTFLIAGNHDALLNNRERVDSLTSILHERIPDGVYFLKHTGYYRYSNIIFAVHSLLGGPNDNQDRWLDPGEDMKQDLAFFDDCMRVALYHGSITGWRNNQGFCSQDGDKKDTDFVGYDLVLLGDIHKHQYMNKERTMAYSGSLLSQNFGETDPDHGVLVWDLTTRSSILFRIPNPYCYCEAVLEEESLRILYHDDVPILDWRKPEMLRGYLPEYCNLRIHLTEDVAINHDFISTFKKALPRARLQQRHACTGISGRIATRMPSDKRFSPGNTDEVFWIRAFVLEKLKEQPLSLIEKLIEELVIQYRKNVQQKNAEGHACWALEMLSFSHMFGYGGSNVIDFTKIQSNTITGIFGRNSYGKSTIIDILTFMLFGKITRGAHGNTIPKEVIHRDEKKALGEIVFGVGNQRYRIVKECARQKNDKIKIVETFFIWDSDQKQWKNYSEEQRKKTDKVIESLLGSCEGFLYTNVCLQQREKQFRDMTQKERKEFLYSLFGLDWFEKFRKEKEDEWKAIRGAEKVYRDKLGNQTTHGWDEEVSLCINRLEACETELAGLSMAIIEVEKDRDKIMALQKPSDYASLEEAMSIHIQKLKESTQLAMNEKTLAEEISSLEVYASIHDEQTILAELTRLGELIVSMDVSALEQEGPEIRRWIVCSSREEWLREKERIGSFLDRSESIEKDWNDEKTRIEKEILGRKAEIAGLVFIMDHVVESESEWEILRVKAIKAEQEIVTLESKLLRDNVFSEEEKMDQIEDVLQETQRLLYDHKGIECKIQMLRQNVQETMTMEFNPDCAACSRNPYFLKQTEREKMLRSEEATAQKIVEALEKMREPIWTFLQKMENVHVDDATEMDMERLYTFLRSSIQKNKEQKMEALRKKEQQQKKVLYYKNLCMRYENTKKFRASREHKASIEKLHQELMDSEKKKEYNELMRFVKNASLYEKIRSYWDKNKGGASSLEELLREKKNWQKKREEWLKKKGRLVEAHKELLEMGKKRMRCEVDIEILQKQLEALTENEKITIKRKEYDKKRIILRKQMEDCTENLHTNKTSLESVMIRKKEWEANSKKWKECQEKSRMLQCLMDCIDRDGLPLYLLKMYLPIIEDDINMLIHTFLDNKLVLRVQGENVVVGLQGGSCAEATPSNYMGGMESFIVDLSVKMGFAKYSRLPQSNFFIIDEGISVFDQERIANIYVLFNFLTSISEHVFLISHLPTIKDFVSQSIEIEKREDQKSHLQCCF